MSANVQLTVYTEYGKGDVVVNALRSGAARHLRGDLEMTVDSCRGDRIKLLTDDVGLVVRIARSASASVRVIGSPSAA